MEPNEEIFCCHGHSICHEAEQSVWFAVWYEQNRSVYFWCATLASKRAPLSTYCGARLMALTSLSLAWWCFGTNKWHFKSNYAWLNNVCENLMISTVLIIRFIGQNVNVLLWAFYIVKSIQRSQPGKKLKVHLWICTDFHFRSVTAGHKMSCTALKKFIMSGCVYCRIQRFGFPHHTCVSCLLDHHWLPVVMSQRPVRTHLS